MPNLPVTVTWDLQNAMTEACGEPFADSYLSGAIEGGGVLACRTFTAKDRLEGNFDAMRVIRDRRLRLEGPDYLARLRQQQAA
jgi:hypothetical protein